MAKRKPDDATQIAQDQSTEATPPAESAPPQQETARKTFNPVRSWSERFTGPVRYEVLTDSRMKKIIIKFKLAEGEKTPPEEVLAVMRSHKVNEGRSTGLRFEDSRLHGKVWTLPNDPEGRALTATIESDLVKVATRMESGPSLT